MPFTNEPISEDEARGSDSYVTIAPGEYTFIVKATEEKQSFNKNNMIVLDLEVDIAPGRTRRLRQYLTFTRKAQWKIRQFYECIGRIDDYNSALIDGIKLIGATGLCFIDIETLDGKELPYVKKWIAKEKPQASSNNNQEEEEEDIPFN